MELQRYESLAQAAERTGISRKTLRRRIASGQLPVFSSGRRILRVRPEDVDAMLRPFWMVEWRQALQNQSAAGINYVVLPRGSDYMLALRSYSWMPPETQYTASLSLRRTGGES